MHRSLREERRVDGDHDHDLVACGTESGDDTRDRRADVRCVVENVERELEPVGPLPDGDPLVACVAQQAPGAFGERLAAEPRECLRRAEARARAPDEQDARQLSIRHASV